MTADLLSRLSECLFRGLSSCFIKVKPDDCRFISEYHSRCELQQNTGGYRCHGVYQVLINFSYSLFEMTGAFSAVWKRRVDIDYEYCGSLFWGGVFNILREREREREDLCRDMPKYNLLTCTVAPAAKWLCPLSKSPQCLSFTCHGDACA